MYFQVPPVSFRGCSPFSFSPNSFIVGVLNAVLSVSALAGMLCPAPWSCVCLVSALVSQLVSQSASLFFSLGCCVRLLGLVFVWSPVLSPNLSPRLPACWLPGLVFVLSPVLSPNLSPSLPPSSSPWDGVSRSLVFSLGRCVRLPGLVFLLSSVLSSIWPSMLCPPPWSCFGLSPVLSPSLFPKQSSVGVLNAVSASLVLCFSCLRSCLPSCLPAVLECGVCGLGLSQEFYVRFVQLFGVYGGVIFGRNCFILLMEEILHHLACTKRCKKSGRLQYQLFTL